MTVLVEVNQKDVLRRPDYESIDKGRSREWLIGCVDSVC